MEPRATIVTVLFTDWVNSTELIQRLGDEHAQRVFEDHRERLREAIAAHRGREVKWTGDGLMAVFPNAADGVRCAIAMQQQSGRRSVLAERLAVRIELNVGEALPDEADYFGTPVVVARRLCDRAAGGQILCSSLIPGVLAGRQTFQFRACGDLVLKGITSPVAAHEVIYERAVPPTDTPFVGRLAELATLERSVQAAHSGVGGLVMLAGEAGIGKTRLVEEVAARARRSGARVLWGGCDEGAGSGAYGPFREALDGYVRETA
jgi:class 3 adenylate cyclase